MKKIVSVSLGLMVAVGWAAGVVRAADSPSATTILNQADDVANAPKDYRQHVQLTLIDKNNQSKDREMEVLQKGSDKRMLKFLAPADQKGIAFLSLPNDVMYVYLPAFKKVRRIATHVKNTKFSGTDFTYEDLEAKRYSEKWLPVLAKSDDQHYVLELSLKPSAKSDYSKMVMYILKNSYYADQMELYDKAGKLFKVMSRTGIEQINGYWLAKETLMDDKKEQHKTRMVIKENKFDLGLKDDLFSERNLSE